MRLLVDTSVDSALGVAGSSESLWVERWLLRVGLLPISSVTVFERCFGLSRALSRSLPGNWKDRLRAYHETIAEQRLYEVIAWDTAAALLAGSVLAGAPFAPPGFGRRAQARRRTDARRSWVLDIFIAAQAAADARVVLTRNARDFRAIASLLPAPWELTVLSFPEESEAVFD